MSNEVSVSPVIVEVFGKGATERKLSVVNNASGAALLALSARGGAVGKAAGAKVGNMGLVSITQAACKSNFRPLAEFLAGALGEAVVISGRATFESLPDKMEERILKAKSAKNGGYRETKDGTLAPSAGLKLAMELKAICVEIVAQVSAHHAAQRAEREANATAIAQ